MRFRLHVESVQNVVKPYLLNWIFFLNMSAVPSTYPEDNLTKESTNETYIGRNRAPSHGEAQESKVNG
jgi:hypothetical protein